MPYLLPDGRTVSLDMPFELNDVSYPANFLRLSTELDRDRLGIVWQPDPEPFDQRFYWGRTEDGELIPKDYGQLVDQWVAQTRTTAGTLLAPSDWLVVREADNGTPVPDDWRTWRESIRTTTGMKITAIRDTADTAALAAYITSPSYSQWPADPSQPQPMPVDVDGLNALAADATSVDQVFG